MHIFTLADYLLVPIYVTLLILLMNWYNKKNKETEILSKYFSWGFKIKILFAVIYALAAEHMLGGDTEMYFTAGIDFKRIVLGNTDHLKFIVGPAKEFGEFYEANMLNSNNYGYVNSARNLSVIKFVALFSTVSFNSYSIISLFFSTISFLGLWGMFKVFYKIYPAYHKEIFLTFFLIPSLLFWGSGILKDTLCIGFLGIGFYTAYNYFFLKKFQLKYIIVCVVSFYLLYMLKPYILFAFMPMMAFWYYLKKINEVKHLVFKTLLVILPFLLLTLYITLGNFNEVIAENAADNIAENMITLQDSYKRMTPDEGSLIDYGEITPTYAGIAKLVPKIIITVLFRPFLWEAHKITSFLAALEGAFLFLFTLYVFIRKGPVNAFKIILKDSTIIFCFIFSIIFAIAIGLNCFNLGTLVRYKIPCLPFYLISLVIIAKKQSDQNELKQATVTI
jgi:hypothetical protein